MAHKELTKTFYSQTEVKFRDIPSDLLELYLETGESMDKAGAYGIQSYALSFIEKINGSYSNVVGLPVDQLLIGLEVFVRELNPNIQNWRECFV